MDLVDPVQQMETELVMLADDTSEIARMRRIVLNNALADFCYGAADILKGQGKNREADEGYSRANTYWGRVIEDASDLKLLPE